MFLEFVSWFSKVVKMEHICWLAVEIVRVGPCAVCRSRESHKSAKLKYLYIKRGQLLSEWQLKIVEFKLSNDFLFKMFGHRGLSQSPFQDSDTAGIFRTFMGWGRVMLCVPLIVIGQHVMLEQQTKHNIWLSFVQFIQDYNKQYNYYKNLIKKSIKQIYLNIFL